MKQTWDFLDELKTAMDVPSDYALARRMAVHKQQISKWRTGQATFDDATAIKIAAAIHADPRYVIACMHLQRATPETRQTWRAIAAAFAG